MSKLFGQPGPQGPGSGGVPFPRSAEEWLPKLNPATGTYFTPAEAEHKMRQDVFGQDYTTDAKGAPIERGKGSALQQTQQHLQALDNSREAERARAMRLGWGPHLEGAFDPRMQAEVDRRVAEALAGAKTKPARKKPGRKPKSEPAAAMA